MSRVGETGVGEMGIGETGVGEMGVGETGPNLCSDYGSDPVHDTLPKTSLPKRHFAEKTFRQNDTMPKILLRCNTSPQVSND